MKQDSVTKNSNNVLGNYFNNVSMFSGQHINDIRRFEQLLTTMRNSSTSKNDNVLIGDFEKEILDFTKYCLKENINLDSGEVSKITILSNSDYPIPVKKRMAEDLIYKIKKRYEFEIKKQKEQHRINNEVYDLENPGFKLLNWIKLVLFSLNFGTITVFFHNLRSSSITVLKRESRIGLDLILKNIKKDLDMHYYFFTNKQYNALVLFTELYAPLNDIINIKYKSSYSPDELEKKMNSFSSIYLKILKNKTIVIEAVDQIVKIRKHDHGLKSMILKFISVNFADNKIKKIRPIDFYNDYIEGVLLSYYTSSKGILIKSIDQVVYILGIDITIEENYKMLTQEAEQNELSLHKTRNTESRITENKYLELSRIVDTYIPLGEKIIQQMLVYELKQAYKSWQLEIKVKPLLPIKTYIENYIKHFIDLFMVEDEFILNYDSREYKNYLDIKPELINTVKKYNLVEFDLFGSSAKVFSHYVLPEESTLENFFSTLFSPNYIKTIFSAEIKYVRPILQKISSLTYELAMRLNEIITDYYNNKEVIFKDFIRNYDFFENAFFKIDAFNKLPLIFRKDVIRLKDFLEGACSIAFYICKHLKHPGIDAIFSDKNNFEIKIKVDDNINNSGKEGKVDDKSFNEIYVDNLTAFKKREYLYDYILPGFYDESHRYYLDIPRFVVYCNVNNFLTINSHFGYNAGDNLFIEMSRIIKETIYKISNTNGVEVIRLSGTEIVIYFNEIERAELIDKIIEMNRSISNLEIYSEKKSIPSISFSVGIFEEYKNSIFEENLEIVQKIMNFARKNGKNQTAFVKNSTYRLTKKELLDDIALAGRYLASVS